MGDFRLWAKEARFDRFARNDVAVVRPKPVLRKDGREEGVVATRRDDGGKGERKGDSVVEQVGVDGKVTVGFVVVSMGEVGRKKRFKRQEEGMEVVKG